MPDIILLSASFGSGHTRAAAAIKRAFEIKGFNGEVSHLDLMDYGNRIAAKILRKGHLYVVNKMPNLLAHLYQRSDQVGQKNLTMMFNTKLISYRLVKELRKRQPDMIICTHFMAARLISTLKKRGMIKSKLGIVVTDIDPHAWWLCDNYDHYFVAMEESSVYLQQFGINAENITISGIPVDPLFSDTVEKTAIRKQLNLAPNKLTILVTAGGSGCGLAEEIVHGLMQIDRDCQVVVICGNNENARISLTQYLNSTASQRNVKVSFQVKGFVNNMHEYMSAADLMIGKPGGISSYEVLAKTLALVIVNPVPGQEERNADHLLEAGVAIRCNNLPTLTYRIEKLLSQPQRINLMQENARILAKPYACFTVADKALSMCGWQSSTSQCCALCLPCFRS